MRKLLTIIATMIMCDMYNAYSAEAVYWIVDSSASKNSCTINGNITTPNTPQKTGFRFIGWAESTLYDLLAVNGQSITPTNNSTSNPATWSTGFSYATISGRARCSSTVPSVETCYRDNSGATCPTNSNPATTDTTPDNNVINYTSGSNDIYCWCKVTNGGGLVSVSSLQWVMYTKHASSSECANYCAFNCAGAIKERRTYRRAMLGITSR